MKTTATIHQHPADENIIVLRTPIDQADEMGRMEFARYDSGMHAYLVHIDHLETLRRQCKRIDMYLIDQRQAPPGDRTLMPECANCGQPAKLSAQPNRCPACGEIWRPAFVTGENPLSPLQAECVRCAHRQLRSFGYCGQCGAVMPPDDRPKPRRILAGGNLADPLPLSAVAAELVDNLDDGPTTAEWAQLARIEIRPCKATRHRRALAATTDVLLPDDPERETTRQAARERLPEREEASHGA